MALEPAELPRPATSGDGSCTTAPDVAVVIVSYRSAALTVTCLRSVERERAASKLRIVAVVVDNDSGDFAEINHAVNENQWSSWVSVVAAPRNGGFAYGNNLGIRLVYTACRPRYIHLLNPDTQVASDGIGCLVEFLDSRPEVGIAGSGLDNADGTPWNVAFRFPGMLSEVEAALQVGLLSRLLKRWVVPRQMGSQAAQVDWICGASMMIRPSVLSDVGGMDENFFLYFEETDFCRRAAAAGFSTWYVPTSRVMHIRGQSTNVTSDEATLRRLPGYWFESRRRYFAMSFGVRRAMLIDVVALSARALGVAKQIMTFRKERCVPYYIRDLMKYSVLRKSNRDFPTARLLSLRNSGQVLTTNGADLGAHKP